MLFFLFSFSSVEGIEEENIDKSIIKNSELHLFRAVQPHRYFDSVGQKSAILGTEDGSAEIWIYPYKVLHDLKLHFLIEETGFDIKESNGEIYCAFKLKIKGETVIEILTEKSILISLPPYFPTSGDRTTGLKIINTSNNANQLRICIEGQGEKDYVLDLVTARSLASLQGVEVKDGEGFKKQMKIDFRGKRGEYSRKEVKILFK